MYFNDINVENPEHQEHHSIRIYEQRLCNSKIKFVSVGNLHTVVPAFPALPKSKLNVSDCPMQSPYNLSFSCCSLMILLVSSASRFWCINSWRSCSRRRASLCLSSSVMNSSFPCNQNRHTNQLWRSLINVVLPGNNSKLITYYHICHFLTLLFLRNAFWKTLKNLTTAFQRTTPVSVSKLCCAINTSKRHATTKVCDSSGGLIPKTCSVCHPEETPHYTFLKS